MILTGGESPLLSCTRPVAALVLVVLPVAPAGAGSPFGTVEIDVETSFGEPPTNGPFEVTGTAVDAGLMCDSGWTVDLGAKVSPRQAIPQGINVQAHKAFLCGYDYLPAPGVMGDDGFIVKLQVRVDKKGNHFTWFVVSGWGDYEDLQGNGSGFGIYNDVDPVVFDTFIGKVR
jgi:hypothetical protein